MNQAVTEHDQQDTDRFKANRISRDQMVKILDEKGVSHLLVILRNSEYDADDVIDAVNRHQESFNTRMKRVFTAVVDTVFPT